MIRKFPPSWSIPLTWGFLGALLFGGIGAAYGAWWYYTPEAREAYIQEQLSLPHFDSPRYIAGIVAWRYRTLGSLIIQYAFGPTMAGFAMGTLAGKVRHDVKHPSLTNDVPPFTLLELMVVLAIIAGLMTVMGPVNYGLVYYEGKDQFHWLMQLESREEPEQREAVAAVAKLLENPPFPCRSTLIPALAKAGPLAEPALPILEKLTKDEEAPVREAAVKAVEAIREILEKSTSPKTL